MKSVEQIADEVRDEMWQELSTATAREFATKFIEAWLAQQTPVAYVYLHEIQQSRELGTYAPAYPVPVGTAFEKSAPVFLAPPLPKVEQELADAFVLLWSSDDRAAWDKKAVEHFDSLLAKVESCCYLAPPTAKQEPTSYQFQDRNGQWKDFLDRRHYENTLADGTWPIRALYTAPPTAIPEGWISVEDKLPHTGDLCLICINGVRQNEVYTFDCADSGEYSSSYFWSRDDLDECPTMSPRDLWQPLPPPPGEKK